MGNGYRFCADLGSPPLLFSRTDEGHMDPHNNSAMVIVFGIGVAGDCGELTGEGNAGVAGDGGAELFGEGGARVGPMLGEAVEGGARPGDGEEGDGAQPAHQQKRLGKQTTPTQTEKMNRRQI
jgi:hypothetical protein